ncbi:hypothetical protein KR51_00016570 [Rubidibacter lacunae KORDI 51-2]|uniref:Uncharacterized protein n=1 Tax=Rubidibacter lacunae KORDI 51-2 TaxID=582515 RepID=U5DMH7_9CHRO|nr:hypothetical protein KR51_00016570 [Rubidibacter lacunae KORDI 51-2]
MSQGPTCQDRHTVKEDCIHTGKQNFLCKQCDCLFVENPTHKTTDVDTRSLVDRLLLKRISRDRIACALQVFERWLQDFVKVKVD